MTTKKMLVAYDLALPNKKNTSDFLVPVWDEHQPRFIGLQSKKFFDQGMMVYIGVEITKNDVFARFVHTGRKIESVDGTLKSIEAYIRMLQDYKIGNILEIETSPTEAYGFQLKKVKDTPGFPKPNLP